MAEITADGYLHLRTVGPPSAWFIELRDDLAAPVVLDDTAGGGGAGTVNRLDAADTRMTAADNAGAQTMVLEATITGADLDAALPVTVEGIVGFAAVSGGSALTAVEAFTPFVFGDAADECVFRLNVELPQQV